MWLRPNIRQNIKAKTMNTIIRLMNALRKNPFSTTYEKPRQRFITNIIPDVVYAIGDIHGCYDQLIALEKKIIEDARKISGTKILIFLGDYVDRGSKAAAVLDFLIKGPQPDFQYICLAGNHEEVMLDFLKRPSLNHPWLKHGGLETLQSYGFQEFPKNREKFKSIVASYIPDEHILFLKSLPLLFYYPGYCFVHAGIEDGVPLKRQKEATLLWARMPTPNESPKLPFTVVHGHTVVQEVCISKGYINVDTGAYKSNILSAIKITTDRQLTVMDSQS